jgi:hypothetical protein
MYFGNEGELMSTNGWIMAPVFKLIIEYERERKGVYPNIQVGEDFTGYRR